MEPDILSNVFGVIIAAIFINNILLAQFLGNCPFLGTSKKMDTAIGMALAVVFVLVLAAFFTYYVWELLVKFNIKYLDTLTFILVIAALVQFVEMFLKKSIPALYKSLGIFLPLITTNCAVMGVALLNIQGQKTYAAVWPGHTLATTMIVSTAYALGFGLALVLFAGVREKFEIARVPKALQGTGIGLVTAGLFSLAFFAFQGMI